MSLDVQEFRRFFTLHLSVGLHVEWLLKQYLEDTAQVSPSVTDVGVKERVGNQYGQRRPLVLDGILDADIEAYQHIQEGQCQIDPSECGPEVTRYGSQHDSQQE